MKQNYIIHADNFDIIRKLPDKCINLIYIDPPFNIGHRQHRVRETMPEATDFSFDDKFDDYIGFLRERIVEARRILTDNGSFFFHIDYREAAYCKIMLDEVFGRKSFINEIIWSYDYGGRSKTRWSAKHDNIYWYAKNPKDYVFNYDNIDRIPYLAPGLVGPEKAARGKTPTDCYSADTEVLTYDGWKLFSNVTDKDKLASVTADKEIIYCNPVKLHAYRYNGDMIQFKAKTIDLCVTPDHNMYVRSKHGKHYDFIKACDINQYQYVNLMNNLVWKGHIKEERFYLPEIDYKKPGNANQFMDGFDLGDFCEFLGWWIAEGSIGRRKRGNVETYIAQVKPNYRKQLEKLLTRMGFNWYYRNHSYTIGNKKLTSYFSQFGCSYEKEIPREFLYLSPIYLQRLYNGLMMGDGDVRYFQSYFTTSYKLADQIQELLLKLGYNSSLSICPISTRRHNNIKGKEIKSNYPKYIVYRRKSKESSLWKKHITYVPYDDMVYCATVEPYHTLIVRRNGRISVCGNCWSNTIVHTNGKEKTGYPTQKPLKIIERIVRVHSNEKDMVLDFFAGSGTIGEAAAKNNRNFFLIDSNIQAIEIMKERLNLYPFCQNYNEMV